MSVDTMQARLDRLEACEAIRACLHKYCRAIDRRDPRILATVFWPDSKVEYGIFQGGGKEFSDSIHAWMDGGFALTDHLIGNVTITVSNDRAHSECYLLAFHHLQRDDGTVYDWLVGGRYQDRFERRDGEWRIVFRRLIYDWYRDWDDTRDWAVGLMGVTSDVATTGTRAPDDWLELETVLKNA